MPITEQELAKYKGGSPYYYAVQRREGDTSVTTPSEWGAVKSSILAKYGPGQEAEAIGELTKTLQEGQMSQTFGSNWRAQVQSQMTPQQQQEVATGTPTRINPLTGLPVGTPIAPPDLSNAANIGGGANLALSNTKMPSPDIGPAAGETSYLDTITQQYFKQAEDIQKQIADLKTQQPAAAKLWEKTPAAPDTTTLVQQYNDIMAKVYPTQQADIAEVKTLQDEYNKAVAARDNALAKEEERLAPMEFITRRQSLVEKQANIELNRMAANINNRLGIIELNQGNADKAMSFIDKAIDNYTAERKFQYEQYWDFMQMNQNQINQLETRYQNILFKGLDMAKSAYDDQVKERQDVRKLMLDNSKAGINITDSIDVAYLKASRYSGVNPEAKQQIIGSADTGYTMVSYDDQGNIIKQTPISGGIGGGGLTKDQEEQVRNGMDKLNDFTTRDEVFQWLDQNNTFFRRVMGEVGYVQLRNAAEQRFPRVTEIANTPQGSFIDRLFGLPMEAGLGNLIMDESGNLVTPEQYQVNKKKKAEAGLNIR